MSWYLSMVFAMCWKSIGSSRWLWGEPKEWGPWCRVRSDRGLADLISNFLGGETLVIALTSLHCGFSSSAISAWDEGCCNMSSCLAAACNGKQGRLSRSPFKARGVKMQNFILSSWCSEFLWTIVDSNLKGTDSDDLGLLGSNTRGVLTKKDFFSEDVSLGWDGMLMIASGKMRPWKRSMKPK